MLLIEERALLFQFCYVMFCFIDYCFTKITQSYCFFLNRASFLQLFFQKKCFFDEKTANSHPFKEYNPAKVSLFLKKHAFFR